MDAQMIALLQQQEEAGMQMLQQRYGGLIRYIAGGILQQAEDTEECVNDIYLRVWDKIGTFSAEKGSFSAWLTALCRNTALNFRTRRADTAEVLEDTLRAPTTPEETLLHQEQLHQLKTAISLLDTAEYQLFYRKYYYLQSTAQIAAELGVSVRAVEGKLYRLRKKLQKRLGGDRA